MRFTVGETKTFKLLFSHDYSYKFDKINGYTETWGKTLEENPTHCPHSPILADIELSTICNGLPGVGPCKFCYKGNSSIGKNMSLATFKKVLEKFPKDGKSYVLTQIAFGIGSISTNPELFEIMEYTRSQGVIPNITVNGVGITDDIAMKLADVCGAVAVSCYDRDLCFDTVQKLSTINGKTLKQVNIHKIICEETLDDCFSLLKSIQHDKRLAKLNAVVFLWLKPKGKRNTLTPITSLKKYKELVDYALDNKIPIGFDSCGCNSFLKAIEGRPNYKQLEQMSQSCESCLESIYVNVDGEVFPCSFCEGEKGYEPINLLKVKNFLKDVWYHPRVTAFREGNIKCGGSCQPFKIGVE